MRETAFEWERRHRHHRPPQPKHPIKVDWAVSLENGFVPANEFPAKYWFDVSAQNCNSDFVLFGLTVNSGTQANVVGINHLYTEASAGCSNVIGIGGR
jgi:hypothetical protein